MDDSLKTRYQELQTDIKKTLGVRPIRVVGFLADSVLYADIRDASRKTGVSPELIFTTFSQEGFALWDSYNPTDTIDTYGGIGLDSLYNEKDQIKALYGIQIEFIGNVHDQNNEDQAQVHSGRVTMETALYGTAGMLALRQRILSKDLEKEGKSLNELEQDWYTYAYWNLGSAEKNNRGRLAGKGFLKTYGSDAVYHKKGKDLDASRARGHFGNGNIYFNAGRVAGGSQLLRDIGAFADS